MKGLLLLVLLAMVFTTLAVVLAPDEVRQVVEGAQGIIRDGQFLMSLIQ